MKQYSYLSFLLFLFCLGFFTGLSAQIDKEALLEDLKILSSDEYEGRATGKNEKARTYILNKIKDCSPSYEALVDTFKFLTHLRKVRQAHNIVCTIKGKKHPNQYLVLSAHYDHLGIYNEKIYNGADDNASGTATLLALIPYFQENPPQHSLIFAFFDAEELGLKGAAHFVEEPPVKLEQILLNINLDMVSRNNDNTINICGTYDFPELNKPLKKVIRKSKLNITKKHEGPEYKGGDNWTQASDHGEFLKKDIPYLYFGVEDHPGYHKPEDDFEYINQEFFYQVVELVKNTTRRLDRKLKPK